MIFVVNQEAISFESGGLQADSPSLGASLTNWYSAITLVLTISRYSHTEDYMVGTLARARGLREHLNYLP